MEKVTTRKRKKAATGPKQVTKAQPPKGLVVVVQPDRRAEAREVGLDVASLRKIVGGYLQTADVGAGLFVVCDEDGFLKRLPQTRWGAPFVGTFVVTAHGRGPNPWGGLTKAQAARVIASLDGEPA